jgi:hypothetical protein
MLAWTGHVTMRRKERKKKWEQKQEERPRTEIKQNAGKSGSRRQKSASGERLPILRLTIYPDSDSVHRQLT